MDSAPPGPESTLAERLQWVIKKRNYSSNHQWSLDAGMAKGTVGLYLTGERGTNFRKLSAQKLGDAAGVSWTWLMDGELPWEPYKGPTLAKRRILDDGSGEASEHTPHTPPAQSTTRTVRTFVDRIPEYVKDWVIEVLQSLGTKKYTGDQVRAAEAYIAGFAFKRENNVVPRRLVLGALEAARAVEVPGEPIDVAAMGAYLAERNAPDSGPTVEPVETRPMAPALRALVNRRKKEREDQ